MTNSVITASNFGRKLSGWKRSASSMRQTAQDLLDFGFAQYLEHGDAGYLSRMVATAVEIKGLNAKRMMGYVTTYANVRWNEDKSSFAKSKKGVDPEVTERVGSWWEHEAPKPEDRALDVNKRIESLIKAIEEAENLKVDMSEARKSVAKLTSALDTIELEILESAEQDQAA